MQVITSLGNPLFMPKKMMDTTKSVKSNTQENQRDTVNLSEDRFARQKQNDRNPRSYKSAIGTLFAPYRPGRVSDTPLYNEDGKGQRVNRLV